MKFNKTEFLQKILRTGQFLETYLRYCLLASVEETDQMTAWIYDLFSQLQRLLKDPSLSPPLKLKLNDFLIYLLLLGQPLLIRLIQNMIYPLVRNYCQYDRNIKMVKRGEEYFKMHPQYINGSESKRIEITKTGVEYIHFFLESIPIWAGWIPYDVEDDKTPSVFQKNYELLKQGGLEFPSSREYLIYTKSNIDKKEAFVQVIIQDFFRDTGSGLTERSQKSNILQMNGVPSTIRQASKIRSTNAQNSRQPGIKSEGSNAFFNSQLPNLQINPPSNDFISIPSSPINTLKHIKSDKSLSYKIQFPQSPRNLNGPNPITKPVKAVQNTQLMPSINATPIILVQQNILVDNNTTGTDHSKGEMEQRIQNLQSRYLHEINQLQTTVHQLQGEVNDLRIENTRLNSSVKEYEYKLSQAQNIISLPPPQIPSQELQKLKYENAQLKANILYECHQQLQFSNKNTGLISATQSRSHRDSFNITSQSHMYNPHYSQLSSEEQVRFKRTILKSKQILYKDQNIQFGCVTQLLDASRIRIILVVTSKVSYLINNIRINIVTSQGVTHLEKGSPIKILSSLSQQKQTHVFRVDDQTFQSVWIQLIYQAKSQQELHKQLLIPISRLKFFIAEKQVVQLKFRVQKAIPSYNRTVISTINKLQQYSPQLFHSSYNSVQACGKCLGNHYRLQIQQIHRQSLKISIQYQRDEYSTNLLLQQLLFILSK